MDGNRSPWHLTKLPSPRKVGPKDVGPTTPISLRFRAVRLHRLVRNLNRKETKMKIEIEVSEENESTRAPWWMIIDPKQNFCTGRDASHNIAGMITGPFFSRKEAQSVLDGQRYNFGRGAVVFCASGHANRNYCQQIANAEREARKSDNANNGVTVVTTAGRNVP